MFVHFLPDIWHGARGLFIHHTVFNLTFGSTAKGCSWTFYLKGKYSLLLSARTAMSGGAISPVSRICTVAIELPLKNGGKHEC